MAYNPPIRIRKKDRAERNRLAKNARQKIRRARENHGQDLRGVIDIPKMEDFSTRKEFNQWKKDVADFVDRSNLQYQFKRNVHGISASKERLQRIEEKNKEERRLAQERIDEQKENVYGEGGEIKGKLKDREVLFKNQEDVYGVDVPEKFDFEDIATEQRLEDVEKRAERRADPEYFRIRDERMKTNFTSMLAESFNNLADEVIAKINNMPADDFFEIFNMFEEFNFQEHYPVKGEDEQYAQDKQESDIQAMNTYIDAWNNGEISKDLKDFR